ncbi:MAG TPA: OmpH family outer membrane protein [Gemmataceae bacterium]|nr:OmpH family outer membrane protein [Gemmataceae bacterium]
MSPALLVLLGLAVATSRDAKVQPPPPGTVRVAVVNVGHVFNKFHKANEFKRDLEIAAKPFNDKAKKIQEDMKTWNIAIATKEYDGATKEDIEEKLVRAKRQLEDLADEMRRKLGKQSEKNLVLLWKEMQATIDEYASKNGIELVLGYGDPLDKSLLDIFANVNRKMDTMDKGGTVPLFVARRADISEQIVVILNRQGVKSPPALLP